MAVPASVNFHHTNSQHRFQQDLGGATSYSTPLPRFCMHWTATVVDGKFVHNMFMLQFNLTHKSFDSIILRWTRMWTWSRRDRFVWSLKNFKSVPFIVYESVLSLIAENHSPKLPKRELWPQRLNERETSASSTLYIPIVSFSHKGERNALL